MSEGEHDGASPREQALEACRRNNTELLLDVIDGFVKKPSDKTLKKRSHEEEIADLLNNAVDGIGNHCLHLAATYGSYEVMDILLDQEGLEVDPLDRMEKDTPLHKAVRFVNDLPGEEWKEGKQFVEILLDAGADPRVRNKAKLKPAELVDPRNLELRKILQKGEYLMTVGANELANNDEGDDNDEAHNSASDSEISTEMQEIETLHNRSNYASHNKNALSSIKFSEAMPLLRKRRAVEENISDEGSEVTPPQRRQRQPAAAPRQQRRRPVDDDGDRDGDNSDEMRIDEDAVVEDGATQGPGGGSTADQLAKKMVRLALACEFSRQPIRRADISTKGPDGRRFKQVFEEAQKQLRDKFGMEMTELPIREKVTISQRRAAQRTEKAATTSKTYVLTSTLSPKYRSLLPPPQAPTINLESSYIGLYTFLVSVISLSGGSIAEAKLERYLKRTNADQYTPVDKTEKLLHRLCKEGYLMRIKESSGGEEVVEYMVGPRGKVEVGSGGVAGLVKGVYGESATEDLDARIRRSMGLNEKTKKASGREGPHRHGGDDARNAGGQRRNMAGRGELEGSSDED